eukprot:5644802-Pyramimonas_sp.AAC.1
MGNSGDFCSDDASGDCCVAARCWELWCRFVHVTLRYWAPWYHSIPPGTCPTAANDDDGFFCLRPPEAPLVTTA